MHGKKKKKKHLTITFRRRTLLIRDKLENKQTNKEHFLERALECHLKRVQL